MDENLYYAIVPIKGLNLTCDFVIYSAALFGNEPNYSQTRVGLHEAYKEPYELLTKITFEDYHEFSFSGAKIDESTLSFLKHIKHIKRLNTLACLIFEIDKNDYSESFSKTITKLSLKKL